VEPTKVNGRALPQSEPEGLTINLIKAKLLKNWYWFASFCLAGAVMAFAYNKMSLPYYKISTTILVKDEAKGTDLNNVFRQLNTTKGNPGIQDQVGVLKSYNLNLKTMQYFDWRYSWYKKHFFTKKDIYKNEPFTLEAPQDFAQVENVPISVTPISPTHYRIKCDEKVTINGVKREISFKKELAYGEVFENKHFHFSINKKADTGSKEGEEYFLIFNNIGKLAMAYKTKLEIKAVADESNLITLEFETKQLTRDVDYLNQLGNI
jgi:hypothetical protein